MFRIVSIVSLAAAALMGCAQDSTDDGAEAPAPQLEVPASARLDGLSAEQQISLCRTTKEAMRHLDAPDYTCELIAAAESAEPASCQTAKATCLAEKAAEPAEDPCADAAEDYAFTACDAEVGQYLECVSDQVAALDLATAPLTCANAAEVGQEEMLNAALSIVFVPSCMRLQQACPEAFADDGE